MQRSRASLCLTALQLFALERRKTTISYKYFEDTSSLRAAFNRLADAEKDTLEQHAAALRHDVALQHVWEYEQADVATNNVQVEKKDTEINEVNDTLEKENHSSAEHSL
ncbi:hypothetical protein TraAM80_08610 [Trypanosoma rangeli]|uniref:Uncharacterized protein n=1 Tax=Trypanosoma rangeli TaxID=5698 RepID=A0A422MZX6_TRYRA|nr:uncharacterized protein TraAM80_08610 [Trypanosoma rangeli]RNE98795.1 hypothetical protein TraAM80_08610 [Trypanosoma rangeli]|eukprot:RNE98795.1 hypothetical protein TraAM80_08610 [Trypanosoma rangeli]